MWYGGVVKMYAGVLDRSCIKALYGEYIVGIFIVGKFTATQTS